MASTVSILNKEIHTPGVIIFWYAIYPKIISHCFSRQQKIQKAKKFTSREQSHLNQTFHQRLALAKFRSFSCYLKIIVQLSSSCAKLNKFTAFLENMRLRRLLFGEIFFFPKFTILQAHFWNQVSPKDSFI